MIALGILILIFVLISLLPEVILRRKRLCTFTVLPKRFSLTGWAMTLTDCLTKVTSGLNS